MTIAISKTKLANLKSSFLKHKNFSERIQEIFKKIGEFENRNLKENIHGDQFFDDFYELINKIDGNAQDDGVFNSLCKIISHTAVPYCKNITFWINYNTHITIENLPEIGRTKNVLIKGNRLKNTHTQAYIDKNGINDLSVVCYENMLEKFLDKNHPDVLSLHKLITESVEFIRYFHIYNMNGDIYFEMDGMNKPFRIDQNAALNLVFFNSLSNSLSITEKQFKNYLIFLKHIFEINKCDFPKYMNNSTEKDNIAKFRPRAVNKFRHLYLFNLAYPYSNFNSGSLMIFSDRQLIGDFDKYLSQIREVISYVKNLELRYLEKRKLKLLRENQLKTAVISIIVDSYSHNISAHSLAALKWWIELRYKTLDKKFLVPANRIIMKSIHSGTIKLDSKTLSKTNQRYYDTLGLNNSSNKEDYYSLFDFLQFANSKQIKNLLKGSFKMYPKNGTLKQEFSPRFPVPIDYALFPFLRFLRDKGAFWSGVTRDIAFGGESKTWFKILWEDFANNPLYLGTIAKSEGITKININLEVWDSSGELTKGRFVTIDMSIIDYEEKLSQSPSLSPSPDLLKNSIKEDACNLNEECFVKYEKYSKYAFVKLGTWFKTFRKILDDEKNFMVFLPGGLVGEHALFTIFENTIRNIKHYKDKKTVNMLKKDGIDFWISIKAVHLKSNGENTSKSLAEEELFKVGVWLGHPTKIKMVGGTSNKKTYKYPLFDITEKTLEPVVEDSTGTPRMGGNSQDKACAAMLFNQKFTSVENKEKDRDKEYFPWIRFSTQYDDNEYIELLDLSYTQYKATLQKLKENYRKDLNRHSVGLLKKYFNMWRGKDVLNASALDKDELENPSRAKFLKLNDESDIRAKARKNGVIRLVSSDNDSLFDIYLIWMKTWIIDPEKYVISFCDNSYDSPIIDLYIQKDAIVIQSATELVNLIDKQRVNLALVHGEEKEYSCNVRSHGTFITKYFEDLPNHNLENFDQYPELFNNLNTIDKCNKNILLMEFLEIVLTKVVIFDNRIFDRIPATYSETLDPELSKVKMLKESLFLEIKSEDIDGFNKWWSSEASKKGKDKINFLVMHLSFIETMIDDQGNKYTEERLNEFIKDKLQKKIIMSDNKMRENFIFVITSGRGRDLWKTSLKGKEGFDKFTIFRPVESILSAVESAISNNDHFDLKHNIIKVLFGS